MPLCNDAGRGLNSGRFDISCSDVLTEGDEVRGKQVNVLSAIRYT